MSIDREASYLRAAWRRSLAEWRAMYADATRPRPWACAFRCGAAAMMGAIVAIRLADMGSGPAVAIAGLVAAAAGFAAEKSREWTG